jgi:DNA-binding LytR/AlgR family response regulator
MTPQGDTHPVDPDRRDSPLGSIAVLVVDDEKPALDDLAHMLLEHPGIASVTTASDAAEALRLLREDGFGAVFLDIRMPGMDGLELARILSDFPSPPAVVFVTAYEEHAVEAFEVEATDFLLKPVRRERLAEAISRLGGDRRPGLGNDDPTRVAVEVGGCTHFVDRDAVRFVEASHDYVRLHTADGAFLARYSISLLEKAWREAGFLRIHRRYLVSLRHLTELRLRPDGGCIVIVAGAGLPVSRRYAALLRTLVAPDLKARSGS